MAAHVTPAQSKHIQRLKAEGHSNLAIAAKLGIDRHTVGRHANGPKNIAEPVADSLDQQRLAYLLAALDRHAPCPGCGKTMFWRNGALTGVCNWCGNPWGMPAQAR